LAIKYFIKAAISEFTDKDGKSKKKYQSIGAVFETKHGLMMSLESLPLLALKDGKLIAYLNEPEDKPTSDFPATLSELKDDSIPF
jgi:hypothetical protein